MSELDRVWRKRETYITLHEERKGTLAKKSCRRIFGSFAEDRKVKYNGGGKVEFGRVEEG